MREEGDGTDRRARAAARGKATRGWALACGAVLQRAGRRGAEARGKRLRPSWAGVRRAAGSWVLGFRGKRAGEEDWTGLRWVWAGGLGF